MIKANFTISELGFSKNYESSFFEIGILNIWPKWVACEVSWGRVHTHTRDAPDINSL